jgi:hypothetical protein
MSEEIPAKGGLQQPPEAIDRLLATVREILEMDVALVTEFAGGQLVFRALEGDAESFGWGEARAYRSMSPTANACSAVASPT